MRMEKIGTILYRSEDHSQIVFYDGGIIRLMPSRQMEESMTGEGVCIAMNRKATMFHRTDLTLDERWTWIGGSPGGSRWTGTDPGVNRNDMIEMRLVHDRRCR